MSEHHSIRGTSELFWPWRRQNFELANFWWKSRLEWPKCTILTLQVSKFFIKTYVFRSKLNLSHLKEEFTDDSRSNPVFKSGARVQPRFSSKITSKKNFVAAENFENFIKNNFVFDLIRSRCSRSVIHSDHSNRDLFIQWNIWEFQKSNFWTHKNWTIRNCETWFSRKCFEMSV